LAHHYTEAGLGEQALGYWQRAGERAIQRSANLEAISHLTKGLEILKTLPDTLERAQQELDLQLMLGPALIATQGYGAPEVQHAYTRARVLGQQSGETPQLFTALRGLHVCSLMRGELETGQELGEQLLRLAQHQQALALLLEAHLALGSTLFFRGELSSARVHLEEGTAFYDSKQHRSLAFRHGQDTGVVCLSYTSWVLWHLGYPDQALQPSHEAQALAQELAHPFSLVFALYFAAWLHQFRRERQRSQERAETLMMLSREQGFALRMAAATILRGWALAAQEQEGEGIAQMRQGLAMYQTTGAKLLRSGYLALVAEAYGHVGQAAEGLTALTEALTAAHQTGERWHEAELYRLKGELLLIQSTGRAGSGAVPTEVEACFRQALDMARRQQAKSWELRAAVSLSRLWQRQGRRDEARQLLSEIYRWFTEGFDTPDLRRAKALLEELS
jgi:predicted ATPase